MSAKALLEKLDELRRLDSDFRVFGASSHQYKLEPPLTAQALKRLAKRHDVTLPDDYREFLLKVGNGGAGPSYGVFPFGKWDGAGKGLERWTGKPYVVSSLAQDFPFTDAWSLAQEVLQPPERFASNEEEDEWGQRVDEALYPQALTRGWFPICHHGCALRSYLVVSGPERGHVWYDARAESGPVSPHTHGGKRLSFSDWYERWLDISLERAAH